MSLDKAAKHLEARGRNGDTMLVHMSPKEVESLQTLAMAHGGSLTVNPATGLAEAGFLKNILPTLAGIGLSFIPGIGPLAAAGMVGGFETLRTGDISKGLMAGLGAYGGAGLAGGLSTAGAAATEGATGAVNASPIAENIAEKSAGIKDIFGLQNTTPIPGATTTAPGSLAGDVVKTAIAPPAPVTFGNLSSGLGQLGTEAGRSAVYKAIPTGTLPALAGTAAQAMTPEQKVPEIKEEPSSGKYISKDFRAYVPERPNPYYRPQGLGYTGYAMGGPIQQQMPNGGLAGIEGVRDGYGAPQTMAGNIPQYATGGKLEMKKMKLGDGIFKDTNPNTANLGAVEAAEYYVKNTAKKNKVPYTSMPKTNIQDLGEINVGPVKTAAGGGSIGGYSDGGRMLKGPGDGMSDSIPATISNKQPARLADGEFVVPADVVSHIGNGSTDAGAKRLYAMMDKVRQARTGTKKQGKKIKPEKYMPA